MKNLTKKEEKAIEYVLLGDSFCEATFKAFNCKNRNSAGALSNKLFKKEKVIERLKEAREKVNEKMADKTIKYIDALLKYISIEQIAKKHAENILSNDSRVSDAALDKALKVIAAYPKEEQKLVDLGMVSITMLPPQEQPERIKGEVIKPLKLPEAKEDRTSNSMNTD